MGVKEQIPKEIQKYFVVKNVDFKVSKFEEYMMNDIVMNDEQSKIKLYRNVTQDFFEEIYLYLDEKRNLRYVIKGETRTNLGDTKVLMWNLENKRLDSIKIGDKVLSWNKNTQKIEIKEVSNVFESSIKDFYEISLEGGKKIYSSNLHKFLKTKQEKRIIINNVSTWKYASPYWERVKNLKINDFIAVPNNIDIEKSCNIPLNELSLLGLWLADGYFHKNERCVFDFSKKDKINYLFKLNNNSKQNYKIRINNNGRNKKKYPHWAKGNKYYFTKKEECRNIKQKDYFSKLVFDFGLYNKKCYDKFIPNKIKLGTKKEIIALLSGLFVGDSNVSITDKRLIYNTTSKQLWEDIKICLSKIGVIYTENLKKIQKQNHKQSYEVRISYKSDLEFIADNFNLDEEKQNKIIKIINSKTKQVKNYAYFGGDLIYRRIKSIKHIGKKQGYDIEVKDNNNYIANLILSHNSGKSLIGHKIADVILDYRCLNFNDEVLKYTCGNQIEYRQNLQTAKFGDYYLVDENFFNRSGLGANIEATQLQDYNNIIAKKNINVVFITPEKFINVGATLGLSAFGRDSKNWLSKFLVYKFKDNFPYLIGYVIFDIGNLFRKHGCYVYKFVGGCNNVNKLNISDIPKEIIKHSWAIPKKYDKKLIKKASDEVCPFFEICNHGLCKYEHKKDSWIEKEMKGGLDERTYERFKLSLYMILELLLEIDSDSGFIKLKAKNSKDLKNKVKLKYTKYTNTKMGIGEFDEFVEIIKSNCDIDMLADTLKQINDEKITNKFFEIDESGIIKQTFLNIDDKKIL